MTATKRIDYTRLKLGTITRTFKGNPTASIAKCPKCGKLGERSISMPEHDKLEMGRRPYVYVTHVAEYTDNTKGFGFGPIRMHGVGESCSIPVDATNVDDLLRVAERKRYDAWVDALRAHLAIFDTTAS